MPHDNPDTHEFDIASEKYKGWTKAQWKEHAGKAKSALDAQLESAEKRLADLAKNARLKSAESAAKFTNIPLSPPDKSGSGGEDTSDLSEYLESCADKISARRARSASRKSDESDEDSDIAHIPYVRWEILPPGVRNRDRHNSMAIQAFSLWMERVIQSDFADGGIPDLKFCKKFWTGLSESEVRIVRKRAIKSYNVKHPNDTRSERAPVYRDPEIIKEYAGIANEMDKIIKSMGI